MMKWTNTFNKDTEDLGQIAGVVKKYTYHGHCTSYKCAGNYGSVKKTNEGGPDNCPDCGYALVYRKKKIKGLSQQED